MLRELFVRDVRNTSSRYFFLGQGCRGDHFVRATTVATHGLEENEDFGGDADEWLCPEVVFRVAEEFNECHQCAPWMWSMHKETLKKDSRHDLSKAIDLDLVEEVKHQRTEPVGVGVGVAQVQHHGTQKVVLT